MRLEKVHVALSEKKAPLKPLPWMLKKIVGSTAHLKVVAELGVEFLLSHPPVTLSLFWKLIFL